MNPSGLYVFGACLLALLATGSAIKCYECTTANPDHICEDPFTVGQGDTDQHIVNCENSDDQRDHKVCRKTTTIQYKVIKGDGDTEEVNRVVSRYCGGPEDDMEMGCTLLDGDATYTYDCVCDEAGCNASPAILANISTIVTAIIGMALMTKVFAAL